MLVLSSLPQLLHHFAWSELEAPQLLQYKSPPDVMITIQQKSLSCGNVVVNDKRWGEYLRAIRREIRLSIAFHLSIC